MVSVRFWREERKEVVTKSAGDTSGISYNGRIVQNLHKENVENGRVGHPLGGPQQEGTLRAEELVVSAVGDAINRRTLDVNGREVGTQAEGTLSRTVREGDS